MNIFQMSTKQLERLTPKERSKLYPSRKEIKGYQKYIIFYRDEKELGYKSPEELWLEEFIEEENTTSFQDYYETLENHDDDKCLCETVSELADLYNDEYHGETSFPYFKSVAYKVLNSYVDYKRGHRVILEVFELNYEKLGMKKPKKSEREFFGITYTEYQDGEICDYEGLTSYNLVKKKIIVEKWEPV
jgi:hypothetical protein